MKTLFSVLGIFICSTAMAQIHVDSDHRIRNAYFLKLDSIVNQGEYENITSILVAKDSKLIFEKYYQQSDSNALHNTRSATKSIATLLTGIAIDKGCIASETDLIFKYLSANQPVKNPDPRKDRITIEDLLTMSSVLECDDWNDHSRGHEMRMYFIEDWTQFLVDLPVRSYPFGPPPEERPYGRVFAYGSAKSAAVGDIVERACNKKLDLLAKENLFDPLNITHYKLHYSPLGVLNTAGGSEYRSRDLLKMIQLMANKGSWEGKQLLSENWIEKATSPHALAYDDFEYGYLLWLRRFGDHEAFYMSGNGGNKVMALPDLNATLVITTTNYNNRNAHRYSYEIISDYIIPALTSNNKTE